MTTTHPAPPPAPSSASLRARLMPDWLDQPPPALQGALADSRERWRDFVEMFADLAFETDAAGRLVFVAPDVVLGWDAADLLGQPAETLLADLPERPREDGEDPARAAAFDPFRPRAAVRGQRAWLRRRDGAVCCMSFASAPLQDAAGRPAGARGVGADLTDQDRRDAGMAASLRRAEVLDHILLRTREQALPHHAVQVVLTSLSHALGADGAAVLDVLGAMPGRSLAGHGPSGAASCVLHQSGEGLAGVLETAVRLGASLSGADWDPVAGPLRPLAQRSPAFRAVSSSCAARQPVAAGAERFGHDVRLARAPDGAPVLATALEARFGGQFSLVLWRSAGGRAWDEEDSLLAASVAGVALVMLEHEALQRELASQTRTDALTGLLNRRAFLEELPRHMARLDRDEVPGTLMFADLDSFKALNERLGHDVGDEALRAVASLLRSTFRPTDLVARLGGDEFAVWLNGADQFTAAERAEALRVRAPRALSDVLGLDAPPLTLSIGIAERRSRSMEDVDSLFRRADDAMFDVKRAGRAHWRAAPAFEV